jgi:hypothetical protein
MPSPVGACDFKVIKRRMGGTGLEYHPPMGACDFKVIKRRVGGIGLEPTTSSL